MITWYDSHHATTRSGAVGSAGQREVLETVARSPCAPHREVVRARALLMAADGLANTAIAQALSVSRRSAWAHPPPAPTRRRRRWITISRRCGRRSFRHRAPRTPSAPAVPHLRAGTSAARFRRLRPTASSRARSSPAPRYSSRRTHLSAARSRGMARLTPHYGRVPSKGTCNRRPASPSTTSPCR